MFLFGIATTTSASPLYQYQDKNGVITFTSKKPKGVKASIFTGTGASYSIYGKQRRVGRLFPDRYVDLIELASRKHKVSPHLIKAVIHTESAFNHRAVSPKGALGLMQIMPSNLKQLGVKEAFNPKENILGGVKLLANLLNRYQGNLVLALAAYNAGEEAVTKYNGIPPYPETQAYVKKVINMRDRYLLAGKG